jgi:hypothetical protein
VESGVGEAYEDISTVVLNILQAEFGTAPVTEQGESKMLLFLRCLCKIIYRLRFGTAPAAEES